MPRTGARGGPSARLDGRVRTRGGVRSPGGVRTLGGVCSPGGVRTLGGAATHARQSGVGGRGSAAGRGGAAGRGAMRPSAIDPNISCSMLEDLPEVNSIERPFHSYNSKVLPSTSREQRHVECGESKNSTPHQASALLTPQRALAGSKRLRHDTSDASVPRAKRCLNPSSSSSSSDLLSDEEIAEVFFYGSEEDSDDGDEEGISPPVLVPRASRLFLEEELPKADGSRNAEVVLQWPPRPVSDQPSVSTPPPAEVSPPPAATASQALGPEKFCFQWKAFPKSQIPPELRREPFSNINCGPTVPLASPYDAFTAIWDREIMEHIVVETNRYAQQVAKKMLDEAQMCPQSRIVKWRDTSVDELYAFFAIILASGITVKSRMDEYWASNKDIFITPGFTSVMPLDRFQLLGKCLHFSNNENCDPASMTRSQAKLFKVQPILDHLNAKFSQLYNVNQNLALDESLTMWKGWLDINQFIKNKVATVGIKTYELCESQTGYLWRFEVHSGHQTPASNEVSPISGVVPTLVLRLLNGLEHKGHTIWMDNFYNSPALARELKLRGFDCVGTLRTNRQFVPVELANLKKTEMAVGEVRGCTSGDVDLVVWSDNKQVALISTYHGLATVKCGDALKPNIIPDYNLCMGGVDRKDQMLSMYPMERRRTRVWYKKFFRRLLNASVLNAYILLKTQPKINSLAHRQFRKVLTQELLSKHSPPAPCIEGPIPSIGHFPAQYDFIGGKLHERLRRVCSVCKKRTNSYCKACDVPLCVFTCFEPHHTTPAK